MMTTAHGSGTVWQRLLERQHRRQHRFAERTAHRLPRWRSRERRRRVVAAAATGLVLMLVGVGISTTGLPGTPTAVLFAVTWVGGTLLAMGSWFVLRVLTSNVADLPPTLLDEREVDQRGAVRSVALQVTLYAALVPALLLVLGASVGEPSRLAHPAGLLLVVVILLGGSTPAALLAWDAPDPDPEDDDVADEDA